VEIRVLRGSEVRNLLPMAACVDLMHRTMIAVAERRRGSAAALVMSCPASSACWATCRYIAEPECFGVKLVSLIPRNKPPAVFVASWLVLLFEAEHGCPVALLDAAEITAIRTAAASGLATRLLARPEAGDLALLGAGEQARSHLEAMLTVRPLRRIRVWARDGAKRRPSPTWRVPDMGSPSRDRPPYARRGRCRHHLHPDQGARTHSPGRAVDSGVHLNVVGPASRRRRRSTRRPS